MDQIPCPACCTFFTPRNRSQTYCPKHVCQKARKALWQKLKLATDPEYKKDQRLSQQKWLSDNSDYYRNYLRKNPEKADRNRVLQRIRNHKAPLPKIIGIAKMDAGTWEKLCLTGSYKSNNIKGEQLQAGKY